MVGILGGMLLCMVFMCVLFVLLDSVIVIVIVLCSSGLLVLNMLILMICWFGMSVMKWL